MDRTVHSATFDDLDTATLYALLKLRTDVFVVEQGDPYPELDGRDTESGTVHLWVAQHTGPVAYLRILAEPDGAARIGRVVVAADARGNGLAGDLMSAALGMIGNRRCVLEAQTPLTHFYARYGFVPTGAEYDEGGIRHTPMARDS